MTTDRPPLPSLPGALRRARAAAEEHMRLAEEFNSSWREETAAEVLRIRAAPFLVSRDFPQNRDDMACDDWLWWWIDGSGQAFGMLVGTSRYRRDPDQWTLTMNGGAAQRLFSVARRHRVPAVHLLLSGADPAHEVVEAATRAGVTALPALATSLCTTRTPHEAAELALAVATPLEDLVDLDGAHVPAPDLVPYIDEPGAAAFLTDHQTGARLVARSLLVSLVRARTLVDETGTTKPKPAMFGQPLQDVPHLGVSYYRHLLQGLRKRPPPYLDDLLRGRDLPPELTRSVAGLTVVTM